MSGGQRTAMADNLVGCHSCGLVNRCPVHCTRVRCARCHAPLTWRIPRSVSRSWAFLIAVPASVGLIVLAVGTSLPELVTSIAAAVRREPDLCVGNVVGSNLMNGLLVLPLGALVQPIAVPDLGLLDLLISFGFTALLIPVFIIGRSRMARPVGIVMLVAYLGYLGLRAGFS